MWEHGFALELNGARKRRRRAAFVEKFFKLRRFFSFFPSTLKKEEKMRAEDWARIFVFNGGLSLAF